MKVKLRYKFIFVICAVLASLIFLEISLFVYSNYYLGKPKVYEFDQQCGYNFKKFLSCNKKVLDKNVLYFTDKFRLRVCSEKEQKRTLIFPNNDNKRLIIAGDSFAEGQTNVESRFDYIINDLSDKLFAIAIGCGGFDTVQQIRVSEPFITNLRKDDYFILLTCGNDFGDLLRKSIFGRSKPYIDLIDNEISITNANNNFLYRMRDISYTIGYSLQFWDAFHMKFIFDEHETRKSQDLYIAYINHLFKNLQTKGIKTKILFHSLNKTSLTNELFDKLISHKIDFYNLDEIINDKSRYFLDDKFHWNVEGNKLVARKIISILQND